MFSLRLGFKINKRPPGLKKKKEKWGQVCHQSWAAAEWQGSAPRSPLPPNTASEAAQPAILAPPPPGEGRARQKGHSVWCLTVTEKACLPAFKNLEQCLPLLPRVREKPSVHIVNCHGFFFPLGYNRSGSEVGLKSPR